jgi:RecA/RadA recombinase
MAKEIKSIEDLSSEFNLWNEEPKIVKLKNPILNGMFHGGLPLGSVIQIAAQSGVGKSTLAIQISKELCELGYKVSYIDAEKGLNVNMLKSTGIYKFVHSKNNPDGTFSILRINDCTQVNLAIQQLSNNKLVDVVILDSLGSLDSGLYKEGGVEADNPKVGADTKSLKIIMKTMNSMAISNNTTFIFINHLAQSIGTYIPTESPTGGRAPIYLSDIIIKLTKKSSDFEKLRLGQKVEYEAMKSRFGPGKSKMPFYIFYGQGICLAPTYREFIDQVDTIYKGKPHKLVELRGAGNGSMFINDEEVKFRGENQLMNLIGKNLKEIMRIVPEDVFIVKPPELPDYIKSSIDTEKAVYNELELPDKFKDLEILYSSGTKVYFHKGIDPTGQEYSLSYDIAKDKLILNMDGIEDTIKSPSKEDYNSNLEVLNNYLDKTKKEMES